MHSELDSLRLSISSPEDLGGGTLDFNRGPLSIVDFNLKPEVPTTKIALKYIFWTTFEVLTPLKFVLDPQIHFSVKSKGFCLLTPFSLDLSKYFNNTYEYTTFTWTCIVISMRASYNFVIITKDLFTMFPIQVLKRSLIITAYKPKNSFLSI